MALKLWLPLNGNFQNNGLSPVSPNPGSTAYSFVPGKIGSCVKTTSTTYIDTALSYDYWNFGKDSVSMCGWFKFNKAEINAVLTGKTYTDVACTGTTNLIGFNSYGGFALCTASNNMYTSNKTFTELYAFGSIRTSGGNWNTGNYTIPFDTWVHMTLVFDKQAGTLKFYVNGSLHTTKTAIPSFDDTTYTHTNFRINSGSVWGGNGPGTNIPFYVNDVRVYDHALSAKEVKEISQGLILHYKLDDSYIEHTENVLGTTGENFGNWSSYGFGSKGIKTIATDVLPAISGQVCKVTSSATTAVTAIEMAEWASTQPLQSGGTMTFSAFVKGEGSSIGRSCTLHVYNSNGTDTQSDSVVTATLTGEWQRLSGVYTWKKSNASSTSFSVYVYVSMPKDEVFYISNAQFEKGDHVTPYTSGTRTENSVFDHSGYGHNGTATGTLTMVASSPKYDKCTNFTNTSSYIKLPVMNFSGMANSYTFSWWGKISSISGKMAWGFSDGNRLNLYPSTYYCWNTGDGGSNPFGTASFSSDNNVWCHWVVVGNGTNAILYKNGVKVGTATTYKSLTGTQIYISGWDTSTSYKWVGNISDFRIYSTALSAEDVVNLYNTSASIDNKGNLFCRELKEI